MTRHTDRLCLQCGASFAVRAVGERCPCGGELVYERGVARQIARLERMVRGAACIECGERLGADATIGSDRKTRHVRCALRRSVSSEDVVSSALREVP